MDSAEASVKNINQAGQRAEASMRPENVPITGREGAEMVLRAAGAGVGIAVLVEVGKVASGFLPPEVVVTTQQVISGAGEWGKIALEAGALTVVSGIASWDINQERIRQVAERMRLQKKAGDQKPDESGVTRTAEQQDQLIRRIRLGMDPLEAGGWFTTMKLGERMDKKTQAYIEARSGASQEEVKDVIEQIGVGIDQVVRKSALSGGKDVADLAKGLTTEERALAVQALLVREMDTRRVGPGEGYTEAGKKRQEQIEEAGEEGAVSRDYRKNRDACVSKGNLAVLSRVGTTDQRAAFIESTVSQLIPDFVGGNTPKTDQEPAPIEFWTAFNTLRGWMENSTKGRVASQS
jgi:hypothetical protein